MTQTELPQLSLQRYVDLIRRRRWQLVPISVLGLLIGGLVAFFIPRYYVAETVLEHNRVPGKVDDPEDPFGVIVANARETIELATSAALVQLGWPEYLALDDYGRDQFAREVESRIEVNDANRSKERSFALLRVRYRDRDGQRSADLLNKVVELWIRDRIEALRQPAKEQSLLARQRAEAALKTLNGFRRELLSLQRQYSIRPNVSLDLQREDFDRQVEQRDARARQLRAKRAELVRLETQLRADRELLAETPDRVPAQSATLLLEAAKEAKKNPAIAKVLAAMVVAEREYTGSYQPGTRQWFSAKRRYEMALQQLRSLMPVAEADPDGMMPNPEYLAIQKRIAANDLAREQLTGEIEVLQQAAAKDKQRLDALAEGFQQVELKLLDIENAENLLAAARADEQDADKVLGLLTRQVPVKVTREAKVPPEPTEPNILVVAMIGCVLGLGAAIGLILALDFLQGTFKTVEDVERGLTVPVLGGVSHLETFEERQQAMRSRRRASVVAAVALFLITAVVSVFYIDPTRLPPVVQRILAMLLGA
ncbi:MAG TPA: hypothetical protein ENI87_13965 [bacterium]|nr:hypothetical protein [bacterium]